MNRARHLERPSVRDRLWMALIAALLAGHAIFIASLASKVVSVERANYEPWPFVWVAAAAFVVGTAGIVSARQHARAMVLALATITAAAVLTPSALAVVLLCLLSAYVLGVRVIRFLRAQAERSLPWTIPLLVGICIWIGLVGATAALKIHFAPVYGLLLLAPLAFAWPDVRATLRNIYASASAPEACGWTERGWLVLAFGIFTLHLFLVARPEVGYDANTMHLQISAIMAEEHRFRFDATRYLWALMPMGADWAYSVAYILDGETAARATNLAFGVILSALVYHLVRRHASREIALASVVLLASTPLAFAETSSLYVENLWTAFLVATLLVALEFRAQRVTSITALPLLALLAAGAMQCKVIGVLWLAPVLAFSLVVAWRGTPPRMPGPRGALLVVLAAIVASWPYANAWIRSGNPVFPFMNTVFQSPLVDATKSFDNPLYRLPLVPWSPYEVVTASGRFIEGTDGAAGFHWLLLLPLVLVMLVRRRDAEPWLCAGLAALFFVTVYTQQAYLRYLYPAFMLITVMGGWALVQLGAHRMTRVAILAVGCLFCVLHVRTIYTASWNNAQLCIGCAFDRHARSMFIEAYQGDRVIADYLTRNLPNARVGFLMLHAPSPAGFTGYSRAVNWHDGQFYWPAATALEAHNVEDAVRKFKLTHIVYRTRSPAMETPAIVDFRNTRSKPIWKFQDYVIAVLDPPL